MTVRKGHLRHRGHAAQQVSAWWHEAEASVRANQLLRARRFLRWILACCPEDEEAWLWLAQLASSQAAQLAYLRQAYAFQPKSRRVQAALRQARSQQLESAVGDLKYSRSLLRCLPDERHTCNGSATFNDKTLDHPLDPGKRRNGRTPEAPRKAALSLSWPTWRR